MSVYMFDPMFVGLLVFLGGHTGRDADGISEKAWGEEEELAA